MGRHRVGVNLVGGPKDGLLEPLPGGLLFLPAAWADPDTGGHYVLTTLAPHPDGSVCHGSYQWVPAGHCDCDPAIKLHLRCASLPAGRPVTGIEWRPDYEMGPPEETFGYWVVKATGLGVIRVDSFHRDEDKGARDLAEKIHVWIEQGGLQ